jgi:hypothetical protein
MKKRKKRKKEREKETNKQTNKQRRKGERHLVRNKDRKIAQREMGENPIEITGL